MPFVFVEHTADLGVRVTAPTLASLFEEAAAATTACLVDPAGVRAEAAVRMALEAPDVESLLVSWLNELLFRYDTERWLVSRAVVEVAAGGTGSPRRLSATVWGERLDPDRHVVLREVKAATHHGLVVRRTEKGLTATILYDL